MRLVGKVALITGGNRGIGAAIAERMAKEGATVIIAGKDRAKLEECEKKITVNTNNKAYSSIIDIEDEKNVSNQVNEISSKFDHIDILVNCAGIIKTTPFLTTGFDEWKKIINTNLNGTFLCCKYVANEMCKNGGGSIINFTSVLSEVVGPNRSSYSASKGGIKMMSRAMALELAEYNIRVNCIAPGTVLTDMTREKYQDEKIREEWISKIPLNRIGSPEDVVGAAIFLASEEAKYITGITIPVDGGRLLL